ADVVGAVALDQGEAGGVEVEPLLGAGDTRWIELPGADQLFVHPPRDATSDHRPIVGRRRRGSSDFANLHPESDNSGAAPIFIFLEALQNAESPSRPAPGPSAATPAGLSAAALPAAGGLRRRQEDRRLPRLPAVV